MDKFLIDTPFERLPEALLPWYQTAHRDLPWRNSKDPYPIWVSEIMLQQTRVSAVIGYYTRFLRALPTIEALAACDDSVLTKLWEGLGYYNRARNLKKAAQQIVDQYHGVFPREYAAIRALPGIGDYTAGAICSICFDLPTPAVDGNVLRVISRLTADATPVDQAGYADQIRQALRRVYPPQAGMFTQALMELGATVCGPNQAPDCLHCPCSGFCRAYSAGTAMEFPVKLPKKARKQEAYTVFILSCASRFALEKRPDKGLLAGMWQFPNIPGLLEPQDALLAAEDLGVKPANIIKTLERKHIFTHIQWTMRGVYLEVSEASGKYRWMTAEEIRQNAALPTAFRQFWEEV